MFEASKLDDLDPVETREWLESIDSVLRVHGAERAHYLLEKIIDHTREAVKSAKKYRPRYRAGRRVPRYTNPPVTDAPWVCG